MYTLSAENAKGERLALTGNPAYSVTAVDGLYPPTSTINRSTVATMDGARFNSSRVNERNIVIELYIESPAEDNRINLYKYFKTKQYVKLYYSNGTRDVYIDGYVESMQIEYFEIKQKAQISVICPFPYFRSTAESVVDFLSVTSLFEFPFSIPAEGVEFSTLSLGAEKTIINNGDVASGIQIILTSTGLVLNPQIYNSGTHEFFKLDFEMDAGDEIIINTEPGNKSVKLLRDGVYTNIINKMQIGSKWLQLEPGDNLFIYEADEYAANLSCKFIHTDLFEGV